MHGGPARREKKPIRRVYDVAKLSNSTRAGWRFRAESQNALIRREFLCTEFRVGWPISRRMAKCINSAIFFESKKCIEKSLDAIDAKTILFALNGTTVDSPPLVTLAGDQTS